MKIKIIATGSSKFQRMIHRWGVSFMIGDDILFDTFGDPSIFWRNINKFGFDITKIRHIVLSHDDWDHTEGLWRILPFVEDARVYIFPRFNQSIKDKLSKHPVKVIECYGTSNIKEDIFSTGELYGESSGRKIYEQSLVINQKTGLVIICGCAHPGVDNIVRHVANTFRKDIDMLIGGFHMKDNSKTVNEEIINNLRRLGVKKVVPMHCTGRGPTALIKRAFGKDFIKVKEGDEIEI